MQKFVQFIKLTAAEKLVAPTGYHIGKHFNISVYMSDITVPHESGTEAGKPVIPSSPCFPAVDTALTPLREGLCSGEEQLGRSCPETSIADIYTSTAWTWTPLPQLRVL